MAATLGRSKRMPPRGERLEARITREQKALFQRAARLQGRSVTDFIVASAQQAAVQVIEQMEVIRLSATDSRTFAEALLAPPPPNEALRKAFRRHRNLVGG